MSPLKDSILGHEKIIEETEKALARGGLQGLNLFVGPEGVGKKRVAFALAQFLLCEEANRPCGRCGACQRVSSGTSESLLYLEPATSQLKLDQAKELLQFCQLSHPGRARVAIVDRAETLNNQAANALLKVLEEPPENTYFFFMVPHPRAVLPTLRSRAKTLRFGALDKELLSEKLSAPQWVIEASGGRMDRIEALQNEDNIELRSQALKTLKSAFLAEGSGYLDDMKEMTLNRESARTTLKFWKEFLRDAWVAQANISQRIHPDLEHEIDFLMGQPQHNLGLMYEKLTEIEKGFRSNVDIQISFENFLRQGPQL